MLKFAPDKDQFKILVLGDVQVHGIPEDYECEALHRLVDRAEPDLVVFLGDIISGVGGYTKTKLKKMIRAVIDTTAGVHTPFVVVSGNHDNYVTTSFSKQLNFYRDYPNCLTPATYMRACRGGYALDLTDAKKKPVFQLLFLDCAGTKITRFGIDFKKTKPATLEFTRRALSRPDCPPTIIFQHITVPDVFRLFDIRDQKFPGGVRAQGPYHGLRVSLAHSEAGILGECPCPSWKNILQFPDWKKSGKVVAAVFAHDHKNSFEDTLDDIKIIQTPCAGLSCYGNDSTRGARLVTLSRSGSVNSKPIYHKDLQ